MSEITTDTPDAETTPEATIESPRPADDAPESAWKKYAQEWEKRAKANAQDMGIKPTELEALRSKAQRLDEIEESQKTELQKLQDQLAAAKAAAEAAESARIRASIAAKHGVPEALLTGSTEEALEEAATALLAFKGVQPSAPSSDGQGKQGDPISGDSKKQITSLDELKNLSPAEVNKARREGRLDTLLGKN